MDGGKRPVPIALGFSTSEEGTMLGDLAFVLDSLPHMVWSTRADGWTDYFNERWYEFTGVSRGMTDGARWTAVLHPEDAARAGEHWLHCVATGEFYEIEYRMRRNDGVWRWMLARGEPHRDSEGRITRWFGTCTDIEERRQLDERLRLVNSEMSHRIQNIFAVMGGLIGLSGRYHDDVGGFASTLQERIAALSRAHAFIRPDPETAAVPRSGSLKDLLRFLALPYTAAANEVRIRVEGDDVVIGPNAAVALALVIHELATNALKYGALACVAGWVDLDGARSDGSFTLTWREQGGRPIEAPPTHSGFGTRLAERSVAGQLGGTLRRDWFKTGLIVTLVLPLRRLQQ